MTQSDGGLVSVRNKLLIMDARIRRTRLLRVRVALILLLGAWVIPGHASSELPASTDGQGTASGLDALQDLISYALQHSPEIHAASLRHQAAIERIPQATAWPNPEVNLRYFAEEVQTRVGPQEYAFGLSQPLAWPKRLKLQGEVASHAATAAAAEINVVKNRLVAEITRLWYELALLTRSVAITRAHRDLVVAFERVARARFSTGGARHPDVSRASIELAKIENQLASLKDRRTPLIAAMNALLHRPPSAGISDPPPLEFNPFRRDEQKLLDSLMRENPGLRALQFQAASAEARHQHAQTSSLPKLVVGLDYTVIGPSMASGVLGGGQDPISANLRITLPLSRQRYRAEEREAQASLDAIKAHQSTQLDRLRASVMSSLHELRDAEREVVLYRTVLLPKAKESLGALQRAYSSGAASFTELIEALRVQLDLELDEARALANHGKAGASLDELLGNHLREIKGQVSGR